MFLRILILVFGVYCGSTAVIMIKAKPPTLDPVLLASLRLYVAAVALAPLAVRDLRRHPGRFTRRHLLATLAPGLLLAGHFTSWIIGANMTQAVNASLIVNMVPLAMPLFLFLLLRERVTRGEALATAVAVAGVAVLAANDFDTRPEHFAGDLVCFGSMLLYAFYLAFGRRNRHFPTICLYLVPLYFVAGTFCLIAAAIRVNPFRAYSLREVLIILGLGLVPTVLGHGLVNYSMRHFRGQLVSVFNLGQFVFAGVMAYFIYTEVPRWALYVAAGLVVSGVILALRSHVENARPSPAPPTCSPADD